MAGAFSSAFSSAFDVAASDAIACTDQTAGRIYQRVAGGTTKTVTLAGTYTGTTPSSIEVRIVDESDDSTVQDWTALSSPTISAGSWSGTLSVPQGGWFNFLARSKNGGGTVIATSSQTSNKWGVGILVAMIGQSNMKRMTTVSDTPPASSDLTRQYTSSWAVVGGNGAIRLANQVQATLGLPVGVLPFADDATSVDQWATGSTYEPFEDALAAIGGDCEFVLWHQGEADMQSGTAYATYKASLDTLYARLRTSTGRSTSQLKFGCAIVGTLATALDSTDATSTAIRSAQQDWIDETTGAFFAGSSVDRPRSDEAHWLAASYEKMGRRFAQAILFQLGLVSYGAKGPKITSASRASGSAVIVLNITQDAGTALKETDGTTDGGSLTGFQVSNDDFSTTLTISSTAFSGNTVQLTLSGVPTGTVKVRYQYGENPTVTNAVYDDTEPGGDSLGLPLQPTVTPITATLTGLTGPIANYHYRNHLVS